MNVLYLSRENVEAINTPMGQIIDALVDAFKQKGLGQVEMPPKPGVHPRPDAFIHAMPAFVRDSKYAGMKWVSGYPQNQSKGLPYITGLLILNDADTGMPLCVMDCTWITAMRTGAATAVAALYLARENSQRIGILGCGVQGHSNLLALQEKFAIKEVMVFDTNADRATAFASQINNTLGLRAQVASSAREAVSDMDIVVTAGPILLKPHETIQASWLSPSAFASPVDFDSYWSRNALSEMDLYFTDDLNQYGYYQNAGYFQQAPVLGGDLGELACGTKKGRQYDVQRTMCINLGLAMEDMVVASMVYESARRQGIGQELPL